MYVINLAGNLIKSTSNRLALHSPLSQLRVEQGERWGWTKPWHNWIRDPLGAAGKPSWNCRNGQSSIKSIDDEDREGCSDFDVSFCPPAVVQSSKWRHIKSWGCPPLRGPITRAGLPFGTRRLLEESLLSARRCHLIQIGGEIWFRDRAPASYRGVGWGGGVWGSVGLLVVFFWCCNFIIFFILVWMNLNVFFKQ